MTKPEILMKMQNIFDGIFLDKVVVSPELSAKDVSEWNSLLQISIVVAVESEFNIRFRVGEVETTQNVGDFADLIAARLAEAGR